MADFTLNEYPFVERKYRGCTTCSKCVDIGPNDEKIASGTDSLLLLWNYEKPNKPYRYVGHLGDVLSVNFAPCGNLIATGSVDKTIRLWIPNARGDSDVLAAHHGSVRSVQFSKDSQYLVSASNDGTVKVWNVERQKNIFSLPQHANWVRSAKFSPDSKLIASGGDEKVVKVFDTSSKQCVFSSPEESAVTCVTFHPDIHLLAAAKSSGTIKIWDLRMKRSLHKSKSHKASVTSIDFDPSCAFLISGSKDRTIKVWNFNHNTVNFTVKFADTVNDLCFSKSGDYFASACDDSQVILWRGNFNQWIKLCNEEKNMKLPETSNQIPVSAESTNPSEEPSASGTSSAEAHVCTCCGSKIHLNLYAQNYASLCSEFNCVIKHINSMRQQIVQMNLPRTS